MGIVTTAVKEITENECNRTQQISVFRESNRLINNARQRKSELQTTLEINIIQGRLRELSKRKSA